MRKGISLNMERIGELSRQGLKAKEVAKVLGMAKSTFLNKLTELGTTYSTIQQNNNPQKRAWVTIRKDKMVEKYKSATSAGVKSGINKKFKKSYGISIQEYVTVPKPKKTEPKTKTFFANKDVENFIPFKIKELIETQNKRIERLESLLLKK